MSALESKTEELKKQLDAKKEAVSLQESSGGLSGAAAKALVAENSDNRRRLQEMNDEAEGLNRQHWQLSRTIKEIMKEVCMFEI